MFGTALIYFLPLPFLSYCCSCCSVAVPKQVLPKSKISSIFIYIIYIIYINIEVFLGYREYLSRTATTATLQQRAPFLAASYGYVFSSSVLLPHSSKITQNKKILKNSSEKFVNRNLPFVPLHCQKKGEQMPPARTSPALMINAPGVSVIHAASSG